MTLNQPLSGKVAIVTGASRKIGIGYAICKELAAHGADVFFVHWSPYDSTMPWGGDPSEADELAAELTAMGVRCAHEAIDISEPESAEQVLDAAEDALGPVSILVNNATHSTNDGYEVLTPEILDAHYRVNIRGTFMLAVEFARRFAGQTGGRIVNMTTGISRGPMPDELAYSSTKAAVEAFSRSLAADVGSKGITVNSVNPGVTDTGWLPPEAVELYSHRFPQGRLGQPEDAARAVRILCLPESQWITGQRIDSDGGFLYGPD